MHLDDDLVRPSPLLHWGLVHLRPRHPLGQRARAWCVLALARVPWEGTREATARLIEEAITAQRGRVEEKRAPQKKRGRRAAKGALYVHLAERGKVGSTGPQGTPRQERGAP